MACQNTWDDAIRAMHRRPTLHPHSGHITAAGPIRHQIIGGTGDAIRGRVWLGMRKAGFVDITVARSGHPGYDRRQYENKILTAMLDAWRC